MCDYCRIKYKKVNYQSNSSFLKNGSNEYWIFYRSDRTLLHLPCFLHTHLFNGLLKL